MATTIHPPSNLESPRVTSGQGGGTMVPGRSGVVTARGSSGRTSRTGIWVGLASITMSFAAFTSAIFVREGASTDWAHLVLPKVLYLNTILIVTSSVTLEVARRRVTAFFRGQSKGTSASLLWLNATLGLGLLFVVGQIGAWYQLRAQGMYLATSPTSSFFYVLTAAHGLHLLGGILAMAVVVWKMNRPAPALHRSTLDATSYYWHFMGVLWIYLFVLLEWKL